MPEIPAARMTGAPEGPHRDLGLPQLALPTDLASGTAVDGQGRGDVAGGAAKITLPSDNPFGEGRAQCMADLQSSKHSTLVKLSF